MKNTFIFLAFIIFFLRGFDLFGQSILKDSKEHLFPFDKLNGEILLNHIDRIADSSRIIGLGEVSHFTKECYELKHQIIKRLIAKGYHALVLEVDFGQALLWNDYVTHGIGDLDKLVAQSGWFTYRTQEFKNLLIDIRKHNLSADTPFQIFGMEMTAMNHNLAWLERYFSDHLGSGNKLSDLLKQERTIVAFQKHKKNEILSYWNLFYTITDTLNTHKESLINNGGEDRYEIAKRIAEITRQYATYISQEEFFLQVELRDQFSTRNVLWCLNHLGDNSKIAIWAHNGHVVKESVLFEYDVLGYYLSKWFGEAYYAIGFTFNEGEFGAFSSNGFKKWSLPSVTNNSLTKELAQYESPYLLFDIRSNLKNIANPVNSILYKEVPIRTDVSESFNEGASTMMNINLSNSYDCLIYIDKTNYPAPIEWER